MAKKKRKTDPREVATKRLAECTRSFLFLRDLDSRPFRERTIPPRLTAYLNEHVIPNLSLKGYKIESKRKLARQCLHNLILTGYWGSTVADSRTTAEVALRQRAEVWDAIEAAGYVVTCKGSEDSQKTTRHYATPRLLRQFENWPASDLVHLNYKKNMDAKKTKAKKPKTEALIVLKDKDRNPIPFPPEQLSSLIGNSDVSVLEYLKLQEDDRETINASNLKHTWEAQKTVIGVNGKPRTITLQPDVVIRQSHSREMFRYARNYTGSDLSAQALSKVERRTIRIDGEPVAELDYSGCHIRMLYHLAGIVPETDLGTSKRPRDIYRPRKVFPTFYADEDTTDEQRVAVRGLVKDATNVCLTTKSKYRACAAVAKVIRTSENRKLLERALRSEDITAANVIDRIERIHRPVADRFFTEIDRWLTTFECFVVTRVLLFFAKHGMPILDMHDGVLCKIVHHSFCKSPPLALLSAVA